MPMSPHAASPGISPIGSVTAAPAPYSTPHERQVSPVPSPAHNVVLDQFLDDSNPQCTPTITSPNAIVEKVLLKGTLAPALRRVQPVVERISQRLARTQDPPAAPPAPASSH